MECPSLYFSLAATGEGEGLGFPADRARNHPVSKTCALNQKFDSTWDCPGLRTTGTRTAHGYRVTGSIPLKTLSSLLGPRIGSGSAIRVGLFRAEFYGTGKTARGEADDNWLSWVHPTAKTPDFHIPLAFNALHLP
jgi:hypothetical protein